jgi:hypothetical protein
MYMGRFSVCDVVHVGEHYYCFPILCTTCKHSLDVEALHHGSYTARLVCGLPETIVLLPRIAYSRLL